MVRFSGIFVLLVVSMISHHHGCESARILGLFTSPSKSHLLVHTSVIDALVEKGHDATVVTIEPIFKKQKKYRHIHLNITGFAPDYHAKLISDTAGPIYKRFSNLIDKVTTSANASLHHPALRELMANESFDVIILGYFFNEFQLGVAAHFKCPVIISFMNQPFSLTNKMVGNPSEMAYVPNLFVGGKQPLGFLERVKNTVLGTLLDEVVTPLVGDRKQRFLYE